MANKMDLMKKLQEVGNTSQIEMMRELVEEETVSPDTNILGQVVLEEGFAEQEKEEAKTEAEEAQEPQNSFVVPRGYELRPERKTGRFQLRLPPSVLDEVKELAERESVSVNEWILEAIKEKSNVQ